MSLPLRPRSTMSSYLFFIYIEHGERSNNKRLQPERQPLNEEKEKQSAKPNKISTISTQSTTRKRRRISQQTSEYATSFSPFFYSCHSQNFPFSERKKLLSRSNEVGNWQKEPHGLELLNWSIYKTVNQRLLQRLDPVRQT